MQEGSGIVRARSNPGSYCIMEHIIISIIDMSKKIGVDTLIEGRHDMKKIFNVAAFVCGMDEEYPYQIIKGINEFEKTVHLMTENTAYTNWHSSRVLMVHFF